MTEDNLSSRYLPESNLFQFVTKPHRCIQMGVAYYHVIIRYGKAGCEIRNCIKIEHVKVKSNILN